MFGTLQQTICHEPERAEAPNKRAQKRQPDAETSEEQGGTPTKRCAGAKDDDKEGDDSVIESTRELDGWESA